MGVSLLGLASNICANSGAIDQATQSISVDWAKCNFLGVDLGRLGVRYANGVCSRWNLDNRLRFVIDSAENCLSKIRDSYPGDVIVSTYNVQLV